MMLRGARLLASVGKHGIRCNRLPQRRIMSLGLTSLCQVTTKHRAMLDTSVVPVNKYDLSTTGTLTSAVSALFSTDMVTTGVDDDSVAATDDESEASLVTIHMPTRWNLAVARSNSLE